MSERFTPLSRMVFRQDGFPGPALVPSDPTAPRLTPAVKETVQKEVAPSAHQVRLEDWKPTGERVMTKIPSAPSGSPDY